MLTIKQLTDNSEEVLKKLAKKHFFDKEIIEKIIALDQNRRENQTTTDGLQANMNQFSKDIGILFQQGKAAEANELKAKTTELKEQIKTHIDLQNSIEKELNELLVLVPNLPHDSVPEGKRAEDNQIDKSGGKMPNLPENALPHWDLAKKYDLIDFELGVKITGAGFPVYKGQRNCNAT